MKEELKININLRKGIYVDVFGKEYRLEKIVKNIENYTENVILVDLETMETLTCSVEHFTSPFLTQDEELLTRFRFKKELV